ncbi:CoA transferase [Adlercreutzia sp. R21]|uniref:CoA transferase n=1 Tax=Adlercreutzia wanghongyangiae TaxID=3111451 RepID=UPI002DB61152|nr:CoA transferase [Adlercreutzia sp. R21]MEC4183269.1 CoA transferase [Adlercreutzia sp. R21]
MKHADVPSFGPLSGVRVLHASMSVAGPFAATLFAEMGADVIWVENAKSPDVGRERDGRGSCIDLDRRNSRNINLNVASSEGAEVFAKLLAEADIFIEASKPGMYDKFGFSDQDIWAINPKIVIAHISGYGQTGDPAYQGRASFDPIAQAFGGMMAMNGDPDMESFACVWAPGDYYSGFMAAFASLAAYRNAQITGRGESIDVAQYEAVMRTHGNWGMDVWEKNKPYPRSLKGPSSSVTAGFGAYRCGDGEEVYIVNVGPGVVRGLVTAVGLPYGSELFPAGSARVAKYSEAGEALDKAIVEFCAKRTAAEVESELCANGVPCSKVMKLEELPTNPQYVARGSFIEYENAWGETTVAPNTFPKMANNPGRVWRYGPRRGEDTVDILEDLGYSAGDIRAMQEVGAVYAEEKGE